MINPLPRIAGILVRPKRTFEEARDDPLPFVFALYFLLLFLGLVVKFLTPAGGFSAYPGMQASMELDAVYNFLTYLAGAFAGTGVLAGVLRIAMKKETLRPAARVYLYASVPMALFLLLNAVIVQLAYRGSSLALAAENGMSVLMIVFWAWTIVLVAIGIKVLFGMSATGAAVCSLAAFSLTSLVTAAMVLTVTWIPLVSPVTLVYKLQTVPVVLLAVFGLYYFLEHRQLVQEEHDRWQETQEYAWGAIVVLIVSFLVFPLYRHGGTTDMSQLSTYLDVIPKFLAGTPGTLYIQEAELIAILGLMAAIFFLHGVGIVGRKVPLLASLLSFVYLGISMSIIAGWQEFYRSMDSRAVQPDWGAWAVPLVGLIYLLIVLFVREDARPKDTGAQE